MDNISNNIQNLDLNQSLGNIFSNIKFESISNIFSGSNSLILIAIALVGGYLLVQSLKKYAPVIAIGIGIVIYFSIK